MIIILMNGTRTGKTSVGSLLADELRWLFYNADDFHSEAGRDKMSRGIPLTDEDRAAWMLTLRNLLIQNIHSNRSVVLACPMLKESDRQILRVNAAIYFVYLKGHLVDVEAAMQQSEDHLENTGATTGQFESFEEPKDALAVESTKSPAEIINQIRRELSL